MPTAAYPLPRLSPWVRSGLQAAGTPLEPLPSESKEAFENRLGTALMALFRDTRHPEAFEALHALTRASVLQWIRSLVGREPGGLEPCEVLQDTFVNVYRYPRAFRAEHVGSFRVWVRTIAGNVIRRGGPARSRLGAIELEDESDLVDHARGPAQAMLEEDEAERLRRAWLLLLHFYAEAWKDLGQRDRRALHLVEVEELSYEEAGRLLAVGRSSMKMIVFRSRRRLARRMRAAMGGEEATSMHVA